MINCIRKYFKNFITNTKAVALPMVAVFAFSIVAITTTGVDVNQFLKIKLSLQSAADRAVVSAITYPKTEQLKACKDIFNQAINGDELSKSIISSNITCTHENANSGVEAVTIKGTANVKTFFSDKMGLGTFEVDVLASATGEIDDVEVVFALSVQGTMCATSTRTTDSNGTNILSLTEDPNCNKFNLAKNSIMDAVDVLGNKFNGGKQLKMGVVPYNYKVKFPNTNNIPASLTNNETDPNFFSDLVSAEPLPEILPLSQNLTQIKSEVNNFSISFDAEAWGRSDLGLHTAYLMLDPNAKGHFNNHNPAAFQSNTKKYVILLADGANIGCCYTNNPTGNYTNQYIYSYEPYNEHMLEVCQALKDQDVTVFTILLDVKLEDTGGAVINNLMARCASGKYRIPSQEADPNAMLECKNKFSCYNIEAQEDLDDAYAEIISTIHKPVLDH